MAYSVEQKEEILDAIFIKIENGMSARKAVVEAGISTKTFWSWIDNDETKVKQYTRACESRAEALLDEMFDIVDDSSNDVMEMDLGDGVVNTRTNNEVIQRSRLRYDARKWLVSKLNPKKYGDKVDVTSGGDKIQTPTAINVNIRKPLEDE